MQAKVTFVGAGPGAADLITVRGLRALQQADAVLYAGSLVNPEHLQVCRPDCVCRDSAPLNLDEQIAFMSEAALAGKRVVRLHTGDPSIYGAINEQIRLLTQKGIETVIVPGVSSVFAAAASLGCELTAPGSSQSVVLTRMQGRTPMPENENPVAFARTGATLVFFLSTGKIAGLMQELGTQLPKDTPVAVVYRASWPDEHVLRGTITNIAGMAEEAGLGRQALIIVGDVLNAHAESSCLYADTFSHGYRNSLNTEAFSGRCAIYPFTEKGLVRAREIAAGLGPDTEIRTSHPTRDKDVLFLPGKKFNARLAADWHKFDAHIFVGATGIAVRKIAPLLQDKASDPAILTCSENGNFVISLTSGHLGGANRLARRVARITGGHAVISTATDINGLPALDDIAARENARILNTEAILALNSALLAGKPIAFCGPADVYEKYFSGSEQVTLVQSPQQITGRHAVLWDVHDLSNKADSAALPAGVHALRVSSRAFILGLGCRRGMDPAEMLATAADFLSGHGLRPEQLAGLSTCSIKADEEAILSLARVWNVPLHLFSAAELDAVSVPTPSENVRKKTGTASVSEASCLLAAGSVPGTARGTGHGQLFVPKTIAHNMTMALARLPHLSGKKKGPGQVTVVGLGSGEAGQLTPDVLRALHACDTLAGYSHYLDFVRGIFPTKAIIQSGMRGELERCQATLEAAVSGQNVCMVCSGDPGILAMAGLLFELRRREERFRNIAIQVIPGITAANIAAASLGAPLQNGFALISLSDLLVPSEEVRNNLRTVAHSMLPVTLYNPAGRKRRDLLAEAVAIFLEIRGDVPCAYVKNAGRLGAEPGPGEHSGKQLAESKWLGKLSELPLEEIDMSTLIVIGNSRTRIEDGVMYEPRGYIEKYLK